MQVWGFIADKISAGQHLFLLWVLESKGSSPGRRGFKMAVANDGSFFGTIGGGIMEHKQVEKARALLKAGETKISLVKQYHDKLRGKDQSGMICSGSQQIAFVPLSQRNFSVIEQILTAKKLRNGVVHLSHKGISVKEGLLHEFNYISKVEWTYSEAIDSRPVIHLIGGGHVGLALSELMLLLDFYVILYDNRPYINTIASNRFAHEKLLVDYNNIGNVMQAGKEDFAVIVTFSYRDDKLIFKQLLDKDLYYLGMMGSDAKVKTLLQELADECIDPEKWKNCFLPIGLSIYSKTAMEIAVSIAAQIIHQKNKRLPTGRVSSK